MKTSEQTDKIAEALSKAQGQMRNPEKNRTATIPMKSGGKYSYNYADLPNCFDTNRAPLSENGLSHSSGLSYSDQGSCFLVMKLLHSSGQWIGSEYLLPPNQDPKLMAANITYATRYLFNLLTGTTGEEDVDDEPEGDYKDRTITDPYPAIGKKVEAPRILVQPKAVSIVPNQNPLKNEKKTDAHRSDLLNRMMFIHKPYMAEFPNTVFKNLLIDRYKVEEAKNLSDGQMQDLIDLMESRLSETGDKPIVVSADFQKAMDETPDPRDGLK